VERIRTLAGTRWVPASLDLTIALDNSVQNQTYNTPALSTLVLLDAQIRWMLAGGGLEWCASRSEASAAHLYGWAAEREWATPFVADPAKRSAVVGTIDLAGPDEGGVDATAVSAALRSNGILDTDSYRKLGRNQLRIGMFPAIDPDDVRALTACIDHVIGELQ
jgi:phosphoserine aminotransferase